MKKTAYVTGSNGFLGLNLCEALLEEDWRVLALHRANARSMRLRGKCARASREGLPPSS